MRVLLVALLAAISYAQTGECRWCDCVHWDGSNYSQCSPIPNKAAGMYHTVKCREDGVTPMPGLWTNHDAECAKYSGNTEGPDPPLIEDSCGGFRESTCGGIYFAAT
eukprot:UN00576